MAILVRLARRRAVASRALLALVASSLCGLPVQRAGAQSLGLEFQVNTYTTGDQLHPAVGRCGEDDFIVAWASREQDGSAAGIFAQRFDASGLRLGGEFQVNSLVEGSQFDPAIATDGSGRFVVLWEGPDGDTLGSGVRGQRFDSLGDSLGPEFQVNSYLPGDQNYAATAATGAGKFVVVWQSTSQDGFGDGVFARQFSFSGLSSATEFQVNSYTTGAQGRPAVAADAQGNFVVVWESSDDGGVSAGVSGQRFDATGAPIGSEFQVNAYTTNQQGDPAVSFDAAGTFAVVWQSFEQDGSEYGVVGQRFDANGNRAGAEFQVNTYTTGRQMQPAIAADAAGGFVVAWRSELQDGLSYGIFGQRFDAAGSRVGGEIQVNSYWTSIQQSPAIVATTSSDFVIVWEGFLQDGPSYGIFGRQLRLAILADGFEAGDTCDWSVSVGSGDTCP